MVREDKAAWKASYFEKIIALFNEYPKAFLVGVDNVGSKQMQEIRQAMRGHGEILMGKNTMIRKAIRGHIQHNPALEKLLPHIVGNVGFVFTHEDLTDIRNKLMENKRGAPAKAGALAPVDVKLPPQNTGMGPEKTSFFQALQIPTKISRGTIEILNEVHLIKVGEKVGASESALLNMLNIQPFSYGLVVQQVYENGNIYSPEVLDMTNDELRSRFQQGVANIAAVSLEIGYPTKASIPHSVVNAFKNFLAVAAETDVSFKQAEKLKEYLADPSKFAVAAAPAAAAAAKPAAAESKKKEEVKEESEDSDMGGFGLQTCRSQRGRYCLGCSNPSAEGEDGEDGGDEHVERGIDFVLNHRLQEMNCYEDQATFKGYIKGYMKKVVEHMEKNGKSKEDVDAFKKKIQGWIVSLLNKDRFKNLQFYIGENMAEGRGEGQVAIVEYREEADGENPYLMLIAAGIDEERLEKVLCSDFLQQCKLLLTSPKTSASTRSKLRLVLFNIAVHNLSIRRFLAGELQLCGAVFHCLQISLSEQLGPQNLIDVLRLLQVLTYEKSLILGSWTNDLTNFLTSECGSKYPEEDEVEWRPYCCAILSNLVSRSKSFCSKLKKSSSFKRLCKKLLDLLQNNSRMVVISCLVLIGYLDERTRDVIFSSQNASQTFFCIFNVLGSGEENLMTIHIAVDLLLRLVISNSTPLLLHPLPKTLHLTVFSINQSKELAVC
uniref:Large ribosomal subunit protein uL10 n=1 Tax=Ditylenchus dipsaci TaxID=166011 RepID=A0A915DTS8_9BILA